MSCLVCLDDYRGKIKPITCQYCPADACVKCTERYLLQSFEDPHCITCKRGWGPEFMAENFTKLFRGRLRLHRRRVLFEREKAILPALQIYVEYKRDSDRLKKEIDTLVKNVGTEWSSNEDNKETLAYRWRVLYEEHNRMARLISEITRVINETICQIEKVKLEMKPNLPLEVEHADVPSLDHLATLTDLRKKRDESKKKREEYREQRELTGKALQETGPHYLQQKQRLRGLTLEYNRLIRLYNDQGGTGEVKEKREFIMRCPADDCRGFLSTAYKCGTCSKWACQKCLVVIGDDQDAEHTCNPDTVETAKAIRSETRPCPKCGTRIFKIDGCDQMFCVMEGCGTAFSWNTGHVVTGVIHNPHYYEWLRRNGDAPREAGDIPCGGMPTAWQFVRALHDLEIPNEIKTVLMESFRGMQDLIQVRLPNYPARMPQLINKENDIAYLMNLLDEDEWKRQLEFTEARFNRKKEIGQILQTLVTAGSDMMNRLFQTLSAPTENGHFNIDSLVGWLLDTAIPELEQLRLFGNESLRVLARRDKTAVPQLEDNWSWKGARALYKTVIVENKSAE